MKVYLPATVISLILSYITGSWVILVFTHTIFTDYFIYDKKVMNNIKQIQCHIFSYLPKMTSDYYYYYLLFICSGYKLIFFFKSFFRHFTKHLNLEVEFIN